MLQEARKAGKARHQLYNLIMNEETTDQVKRVPNPTGKGGFGDNPQNRNPGGWKSEDSISYNYNKLIRMSVEDIKKWLVDNPESKRTMAQELAYNAVIQARKDLSYLKEITDRTEGKAQQTLVHEGGFFNETELRIITEDDTNAEQKTEEGT